MNSPDISTTNFIVAVVQAQAAIIAGDALNDVTTTIFQLPCTGGFLGLKNKKLIIPSNNLRWNTLIQTLKQTCKQRIEYTVISIDGMMTSTGLFLARVTAGEARVLSLKVEHHEEF